MRKAVQHLGKISTYQLCILNWKGPWNRRPSLPPRCRQNFKLLRGRFCSFSPRTGDTLQW